MSQKIETGSHFKLPGSTTTFVVLEAQKAGKGTKVLCALTDDPFKTFTFLLPTGDCVEWE